MVLGDRLAIIGASALAQGLIFIDIHKRFGTRTVLDGVSLDVDLGEVF